MRKFMISALSAVVFAASAFPARADMLSYMSYVSSPTIGVGPLGLVILTQNGANEVDVRVALDAHTNFVSTGGPHHAFAFSLNLATPYNIDILTDGFSLLSGGVTNTPYGTFTSGIQCTGCGNGGSAPLHGPLKLKITDSFGISIADFGLSSLGYRFSSDVMGPNGGTGNIASGDRLYHSPLPAGLPMFLTGLLGLFGFGLRRKESALLAA